mgnify:CR=1
MIEYKSGERLGFIKKAHTRKSVLVQYRKKENGVWMQFLIVRV